jgi:hypothetical protein
MTRRTTEKLAWWLTILACMCVPARSNGQVMTLREALDAASANNRAIQSAELQRAKAIEDLRIARIQRLPVFSITTLASQPLAHLGVTLEQGILGSYPDDGPFPDGRRPSRVRCRLASSSSPASRSH